MWLEKLNVMEQAEERHTENAVETRFRGPGEAHSGVKILRDLEFHMYFFTHIFYF